MLPHRHPVLAAKMLATLDHLAPGRVVLGAGVGWMREKIELFGVPYERREDEGRARRPGDLTTIYERFAKDVRPRV